LALAGSYWAGYTRADQSWRADTAVAEEAAREVERYRRNAREKVVQDERKTAEARAAAAAGLRGVAGRVRDEIARQAARDPAAAPGSPPASDAGLVLADLYRGVDAEAVELAEALDAARSAGRACERSYDSLTP
jgi:hypothetical protein